VDCFFGGVEALNSELRREESVASGRVGNRDSVGARGGAATTTEDGIVVIPPTPEGAVGSSSAAVLVLPSVAVGSARRGIGVKLVIGSRGSLRIVAFGTNALPTTHRRLLRIAEEGAGAFG
jgi:hypothetical protein